MKIFCREIIVNNPQKLQEKGPVLIACNHPNSFLDAIIIDIMFDEPVYSLTRGDVFNHPLITRLLTALKMLPVYRVTEGTENLGINYTTFEKCKQIFRKKGLIQIFSEGKCINEWHLRPLKKGTARLAISSWEEGIDVKVLPVGINYSSFRKFGKNIFLNLGEYICSKDIDIENTDGKRYQQFNALLENQLQQLVYDIPRNDLALQRKQMERRPSVVKKFILFFPAVTGFLCNALLYIPVKMIAIKKAGHNDHYDSVLLVILVFTYPLYILLLSFILYLYSYSQYAVLLWLLLPFSAWSYVQLKTQTGR